MNRLMNNISLMKIMLNGKATDKDLEHCSVILGLNNFDDWREKFIINIKITQKMNRGRKHDCITYSRHINQNLTNCSFVERNEQKEGRKCKT